MYTILILCASLSLGYGELKKPVDLTWNFDNSTLYWKGIKSFSFTKKVAEVTNGSFYAMNEFCAGEHGGTHLDAPYHFSEKGITVGQIPFETLIVPGVVVDISKEIETNGPLVNLQARHLNKWVEDHGPIPNNSVILVRFGWAKFWPYKKTYFGVSGTDPQQYNFPGKCVGGCPHMVPQLTFTTLHNTTCEVFLELSAERILVTKICHFLPDYKGISKEAAQWIVETKKVVGVGVDTASIDPGNSGTFESHSILNGAGLYLLENVNIVKLPARNFTLFVMPMKILEGTGAPLRLIATPPVSFIKYW